MSKELMLKVYNVDYSFILKNYLNEKLWEKEWTLFVYKNYVVTLRLKTIDVASKIIWFEIKIVDNNPENPDAFGKKIEDSTYYYLQTDNIDILKKKINSKILECIERLERNFYIEKTDRWNELVAKQIEEKEKLQRIAEDFLDGESVTNEDIRNAYIDWFVDENEKVWDFKNSYASSMKYQLLTDFYLVFLKSINNNEKIAYIKSFLDLSRIKEVEEEIDEYMEYMDTENFKEEMENNLEDI